MQDIIDDLVSLISPFLPTNGDTVTVTAFRRGCLFNLWVDRHAVGDLGITSLDLPKDVRRQAIQLCRLLTGLRLSPANAPVRFKLEFGPRSYRASWHVGHQGADLESDVKKHSA